MPSSKAKRREYYLKNREAALFRTLKSHAKNRFGITPDEYNALLNVKQCEICGRELDRTSKRNSPHIDHSHESGKIRGVLCLKCNAGLGMFDDNMERLLVAMSYLKERE